MAEEGGLLSFEEWARARTPALLRSAYLLAGTQHAAEDLVQSTLERVSIAWRSIDTPDAYSRQVMFRLRAAGWRRRRVHELLVGSVPETAAPDAGSDTKLVLARALDRLTLAQRRVLVLRFYEDLPEREVAAVLGCSVGTVKSQTHKALAALRRTAPELTDLVGKERPLDVGP